MSLTVLISFIHGLLLFSVTALHLLVTEETTKLATRLWTRRSTKQQMRVLPPQELVENVQVDFTMNDVWKWNWNVFSHVRCNSFIKGDNKYMFQPLLMHPSAKIPNMHMIFFWLADLTNFDQSSAQQDREWKFLAQCRHSTIQQRHHIKIKTEIS